MAFMRGKSFVKKGFVCLAVLMMLCVCALAAANTFGAWDYTITGNYFCTLNSFDYTAFITHPTTITIPSSVDNYYVRTIGNGTDALTAGAAFSDRYNTKEVVIQGDYYSITINANAFGNLDNLRSMKLPKEVKYILDEKLLCGVLLEVPAGSDAEKWAKEKNVPYIVEGSPTWEYEVVNGGAKITRFNDRTAEEVMVPAWLDGYPVTAIDDIAFANRYNISSVNIPDSVEYIHPSAFVGNGQPITITANTGSYALTWAAGNGFPYDELTPEELYRYQLEDGEAVLTDYIGRREDQIKVWDTIDGHPVAALGDNLFRNMVVYEVILPEGLKEIRDYVFEEDKNLTSVTLPSTLRKIGELAFYCSGLTEITIPDQVTEIGSSAFYRCESLEEVYLPEGLTAIADYTFQYCGMLTKVHFPSALETIGTYAFDTSGLTSLDLPGSLKEIGDGAFEYCEGLTEVSIPDSVSVIGLGAFARTGLKAITYPENAVITNTASLHDRCLALESVTLPKTVTRIGSCAFQNCQKLKEIRLPDSVTSIGSYVFSQASQLERVYIPDSVVTIADDAFKTQVNYSTETNITAVLVVGAESEALRFAKAGNLNYEIAVNQPGHIFPDEIFRAYVMEHFDTDRDGILSPDELAAVTKIECSRMDIGSLKGIEYFPNLESIDAFQNQIKELDVEGNVKLTFLQVWGNQIREIDVSHNTALLSLDLGDNFLEQLDVSANTALTGLWCSSNRLTSLDVSNNPDLVVLQCHSNQFTSIDVSHNPELDHLWVENLHLTSLDLSRNTKLTKLGCAENDLAELNIMNCPDLIYIRENGYPYDLGEDQVKYCFDPDEGTTFLWMDKGTEVITGLETVDTTVTVEWQDGEDRDGLRPDSLKVRLSQLEPVELNADNNWTFTMTELPKYDESGHAIGYAWQLAEPVPAEYELVDGDATFTLKHIPATISRTVTILWEGDDPDQPAETEAVLENDRNEPERQVTLGGENNWTDTVEGLYAFSSGQPVTYTWAIEAPNEYRISWDGDVCTLTWSPHIHQWDETEYTWAPDYSAVTARRVCVENESHVEEETVPLAGKEVTKQPTCLDKGETTYTSGTFENEAFEIQIKTIADVDPLGHDWDETEYSWNSDSTRCTALHYCRRDGVMESEPADVENTYIEPTCEEDGVYVYTATFINPWFDSCTKRITDPDTATGHTEEIISGTPATCTESGLTDGKKCTVCGKTTVEQAVIPAPGHDLVHHVGQEPTCTEPGWEAYDTCTRCDYTTYAELPAGHLLVHHDAKEPTCAEPGWDAYDTCSRCDYTTYRELPELDHDLVHHEAKAPTCTEPGWDAYDTCSRCDYTTYELIPAGHDIVTDAAVPATCTEDGLTEGSHCSRCGAVINAQETVPALGHSWGAAIYTWSTDNSTCTATRTCTRDSSHVETEKGTVTSQTTPATTTAEGKAVYTATFTKEGLATQTKTVVIPKKEPVTPVPTAAPAPIATPVPTAPAGPYSDATGSYDISNDGTATYKKPAASGATVTVPDTITAKNGVVVPVTAIADKAFQKDKKLKTVTIGANVRTIGSKAFADCKALTTVTIGKNVKAIGKNAFAGCKTLKTVKGGANVEEIKAGAFSGCEKLANLPAFGKLKTIGATAFKGCKALTKITIGANVSSIGKNAFNGCAKLKTITIKSTLLTKKNVKSGAFKGISAKATVKCPKKKLKDYQKFLPGKGVPKTAKIK